MQIKSISDLKSRKVLQAEAVAGKVVQKSELKSYETKDKRKNDLFYVAVADETASIKMMVYGKKLHREIKEETSYLFRRLITDENDVKVNATSKVSETKPVEVPEEIELEALTLIYPESPFYSISDAQSFPDGTEVSVEGTVTEVSSRTDPRCFLFFTFQFSCENYPTPDLQTKLKFTEQDLL